MPSWSSCDAKCDFTATIWIGLPFNIIQEVLVHPNCSVIHGIAEVIWSELFNKLCLAIVHKKITIFSNFLIIQLFLAR